MRKRKLLFAVTALASLFTLFAFTAKKSVGHEVLTLLFPNISNGVAPKYVAPKPDGKPVVAAEADTFPPYQERFDDFINSGDPNIIDLKNPKAIEQQVEYDPVTNRYIVFEKIGEEYYRQPTYMTFEEYVKFREKKQQEEYFDRLQGVVSGDGKSTAATADPIEKFAPKVSLIDRLFGGDKVDIKPNGNINLTFGYNYQKIENPTLTLRQQRTGIFDFDMDINISANGKIGEKLNLNFNYNTQATFDFDNQMKINYDTKGHSEDEILQNIQAGNVSMPLRSNLIKGAQNLFGVMTELKFGHLRTTLVASQQRSRQQSLTVQGGSQVQTFEKPIDEYDENRHFFVSHYNRDQFEPAMKCLPVPQSLFNITRMEVWLTNDRQETLNFRDIVALTDLGEPVRANPKWILPSPPKVDIINKPLPDNANNGLYKEIISSLNTDPSFRYTDKIVNNLKNDLGIKQITDFEKVSARLLSSQEYSYNEQLGFISINLNVQPDQVVGVALEYTYNGQPYKIGEFSSEVPKANSQDTLKQNVLFVKMLKSTTANVKFPIWDLMMKNVYAVGTANVDPQEFRFDIYYEDPGFGLKRFLDNGKNPSEIPQSIRAKPLMQVFGLDNLNLQGDPGADGIFDFVPGLTINLRSGRIMFPVLEPFGKYLDSVLTAASGGPALAQKYAYNQLYDSTLFRARERQELNRFLLKGTYKSANSAEISLGTFNLPPGSVRVSAGRQLIEGQDYTIDYNIGKLRILNDAILQSGQSVNVSFEDNSLFGFQNRSMIGARFDYEINKDFNVGGTFMNLFERPLTQKVNFGDDPINNKMYGLDFNISKDAPWLTKLIDKLPLIETKAPSTITAQAEVAMLDPGHNRAINQGPDKDGTVYIDDFEGSTANIPLSFPANSWVIASVPQGDLNLFPESEDTTLALGYNRAGLSWFIADPSALEGTDGANPYTRRFDYQELFPNRQLSPLEQSNLRPFDITIYPRQRGPYNYELPGGTTTSRGLDANGRLIDPETRWSGFMRGLNTNDFEAANIEFIEFWMLNPYMAKPNPDNEGDVSDDGDMYIDLGSLSEDIMRDSRQFFENALPTGVAGSGTTDVSTWGRVPITPPVVNAFDNNEDRRALQDIGLDGLDDGGEREYFADWISALEASSVVQSEIDSIKNDPSNDNFVYFRDPKFETTNPGLLTRYRKFNNQQGNSPANNTDNLNPSSSNLPDVEDLNRDNSLNETESYYRYKIPLTKGPVEIRNASGTLVTTITGIDSKVPELANLITDTVVVPGPGGEYYVWYRFKLPLDANREAIGGIGDLRSVRFIRMFWKGFTEQTTFRFATLELGRNQWRRFQLPLPPAVDTFTTGCDGLNKLSAFDINAVSIEENAARTPFNYTIPVGIQREQSVGAFPDILQNEQSLSFSVCGLNQVCDARGIFKTLNMDLRQFKDLRMFVHGEALDPVKFPLDTGDVAVFIRMGSDFTRNFYEYEIPLTPSTVEALQGNRNPDSEEYKKVVWPESNSFDFPLDLLVRVKEERNKQGQNLDFYEILDPNKADAKVRIRGNPNLGYVKGIMLGVRNIDPEHQDQCVEVWFNELRLSGLNESAAWAGLARVDLKLADVGNLSVSGNYSSIGWGSLEQKLIQRQRKEVAQFDVSANFELGKLLPEKAGLKLPFYTQYSKTVETPEYDPYDLDIKLKDKLRDAPAEEKKEIKEAAQNVVTQRGYNFTNVRLDRKKGPRKLPLPWNIENFSLTYAFNQRLLRTPFISENKDNRYKGAIDWQYATGLKPITPFKKLIKKDKYLKFLSEFNFNPLPNTYGVSTNLERINEKTVYRFAGEDPAKNTYYNRRFTWDRSYDLGWDISKSLRFNFDADARSLIDEPQTFDADGVFVDDKTRKDSIITNLKSLGRPKNYTHNASLNYTLPFKTFPFLDFITMKASYTAGYTWTAQSIKLQTLEAGSYQNIENSRNLGHVIQNNNTRQINGDFNFETLYNKSKYLQRINKPGAKGGPGGAGGKTGNDKNNSRDRRGGGGKDPNNLPGGDPNNGGGGMNPGGGGMNPGGGGMNPGGMNPGGLPNNPGNRDRNPANPLDPGTPGAPPSGKNDPVGGVIGMPGGATPPGSNDKTAGNDKKAGKDKKDKKDKSDDKGAKDKKEKKDRQPSMAERVALRPLMLLRKARFNYSENFSTVIPGFTPETSLMGLSEGFDAPGWAFVTGIQPSSAWLDEAGQNGWITHRPELNQQVLRNYTQNFDAGVTVEPFPDFRLELTANRQYTRNSTELFKDQNFNLDPNEVSFEHRAARDLGSYTISYLPISTLFEEDFNGLFRRYENNRQIISQRLGVDVNDTHPHDRDQGFSRGFGRTQQQVLIPAFISAYNDLDPNSVQLDVFKSLPKPNWKLNYNGLTKVGNLKNIFSSVQLSHGYKSTLTVNSYNTDIFYNPSDPYTQLDSLNYDYVARFEIPQVVISEQMQPLIGLDIKLKNDMTFKVDYKKARTLAMSFVDYQLAESRSTGYSAEFGYKIKNVNIPLLTGKKAATTKKKSSKKKKNPATPPGGGGAGGNSANDLNIKFNFEVRDDVTVNHRLDQPDDAVPTRGARMTNISPSVEYGLNRRLKLRLFADYRKTVPKTSQSFPITTLNTGVTVQFSLN